MSRLNLSLRSCCAFACAALACAPFSAGAEGAADGQSMEQAASDPTASLMSIQFQDNYSGDYFHLDDASSNVFQLRIAAPFTLGGHDHIARLTLPMPTHTTSGESGVGDMTIFDMVVTSESWGRWGVGAVMLMPAASRDALGAGQWALGPAMGFAARSPGLLWGLFSQNLFTVAGDDARPEVNVSILQPIYSYSLPDKWSIGTSEMNLTYDWDRHEWTALPLGVKVAKLVKFGRLPVQFSAYYERNLQDERFAPEYTVNFTAKLILPSIFK